MIDGPIKLRHAFADSKMHACFIHDGSILTDCGVICMAEIVVPAGSAALCSHNIYHRASRRHVPDEDRPRFMCKSLSQSASCLWSAFFEQFACDYRASLGLSDDGA